MIMLLRLLKAGRHITVAKHKRAQVRSPRLVTSKLAAPGKRTAP